MHASMANSVSSSRLESPFVGSGDRDSVSAVNMSLPSVCWIEDQDKHNTQGGIASRCLDLRSGTRGLWSVSTEKLFPRRYIENIVTCPYDSQCCFFSLGLLAFSFRKGMGCIGNRFPILLVLR